MLPIRELNLKRCSERNRSAIEKLAEFIVNVAFSYPLETSRLKVLPSSIWIHNQVISHPTLAKRIRGFNIFGFAVNKSIPREEVKKNIEKLLELVIDRDKAGIESLFADSLVFQNIEREDLALRVVKPKSSPSSPSLPPGMVTVDPFPLKREHLPLESQDILARIDAIETNRPKPMGQIAALLRSFSYENFHIPEPVIRGLIRHSGISGKIIIMLNIYQEMREGKRVFSLSQAYDLANSRVPWAALHVALELINFQIDGQNVFDVAQAVPIARSSKPEQAKLCAIKLVQLKDKKGEQRFTASQAVMLAKCSDPAGAETRVNRLLDETDPKSGENIFNPTQAIQIAVSLDPAFSEAIARRLLAVEEGDKKLFKSSEAIAVATARDPAKAEAEFQQLYQLRAEGQRIFTVSQAVRMAVASKLKGTTPDKGEGKTRSSLAIELLDYRRDGRIIFNVAQIVELVVSSNPLKAIEAAKQLEATGFFNSAQAVAIAIRPDPAASQNRAQDLFQKWGQGTTGISSAIITAVVSSNRYQEIEQVFLKLLDEKDTQGNKKYNPTQAIAIARKSNPAKAIAFIQTHLNKVDDSGYSVFNNDHLVAIALCEKPENVFIRARELFDKVVDERGERFFTRKLAIYVARGNQSDDINELVNAALELVRAERAGVPLFTPNQVALLLCAGAKNVVPRALSLMQLKDNKGQMLFNTAQAVTLACSAQYDKDLEMILSLILDKDGVRVTGWKVSDALLVSKSRNLAVMENIRRLSAMRDRNGQPIFSLKSAIHISVNANPSLAETIATRLFSGPRAELDSLSAVIIATSADPIRAESEVKILLRLKDAGGKRVLLPAEAAQLAVTKDPQASVKYFIEMIENKFDRYAALKVANSTDPAKAAQAAINIAKSKESLGLNLTDLMTARIAVSPEPEQVITDICRLISKGYTLFQAFAVVTSSFPLAAEKRVERLLGLKDEKGQPVFFPIYAVQIATSRFPEEVERMTLRLIALQIEVGRAVKIAISSVVSNTELPNELLESDS